MDRPTEVIDDLKEPTRRPGPARVNPELAWKDGAATVLVATVVLLYLGYLVNGSLPLVNGARGMAAIGMVLGWASRLVGGRAVFAHGWPRRFAIVGGFASMGIGVGALIADNAGLLAVFVGSIVSLWVFAILAHRKAAHRAS